MKTASNQLLVIFGASGDLTGRKLLPSLYELHVRGLLPERFCILGAARTAVSYTHLAIFQQVDGVSEFHDPAVFFWSIAGICFEFAFEMTLANAD